MRGYSTLIFDTQTGIFQKRVSPISGTFERSLNATSQGSHVFRLNKKLSWQQWNDLFDGWRRMIVVCWNDKPVYAGFIVKSDYSYEKDEVTVSHASFRAVLARRFPFGIGGYATGTLSITDATLRSIVYQLVFKGTQGSPSFVWPLRLSFPLPLSEPGSESREYPNFGWQSIEEAITDLTNTENGPDIDFDPFLDVDGRLNHLVRVGNPHLFGPAFEFNASGRNPSMLLRTLSTDFAELVTGVFALGKGTGEIKKHGEAATVAVPGGYISLDVVRNFSQSNDEVELNRHAAGEVIANRAPFRQWGGDVLASKWLPSAQPGSTASIYRKAGNWRPAEYIDLRAIGYAGDIASPLIKLKVA